MEETKQDSVGDSDQGCTVQSHSGLCAALMQEEGRWVGAMEFWRTGTPDQALFVHGYLL